MMPLYVLMDDEVRPVLRSVGFSRWAIRRARISEVEMNQILSGDDPKDHELYGNAYVSLINTPPDIVGSAWITRQADRGLVILPGFRFSTFHEFPMWNLLTSMLYSEVTVVIECKAHATRESGLRMAQRWSMEPSYLDDTGAVVRLLSSAAPVSDMRKMGPLWASNYASIRQLETRPGAYHNEDVHRTKKACALDRHGRITHQVASHLGEYFEDARKSASGALSVPSPTEPPESEAVTDRADAVRQGLQALNDAWLEYTLDADRMFLHEPRLRDDGFPATRDYRLAMEALGDAVDAFHLIPTAEQVEVGERTLLAAEQAWSDAQSTAASTGTDTLPPREQAALRRAHAHLTVLEDPKLPVAIRRDRMRQLRAELDRLETVPLDIDTVMKMPQLVAVRRRELEVGESDR